MNFGGFNFVLREGRRVGGWSFFFLAIKKSHPTTSEDKTVDSYFFPSKVYNSCTIKMDCCL